MVQNLAAQKNYNNLCMTMREALASRACCVEGVLKCYSHETLETIIDRIAKAEVPHTIPGTFMPSRLSLGWVFTNRTGEGFRYNVISAQDQPERCVIYHSCFSRWVFLSGASFGVGWQWRCGERDCVFIWPSPSPGSDSCRYWCTVLLTPQLQFISHFFSPSAGESTVAIRLQILQSSLLSLETFAPSPLVNLHWYHIQY